MARQILLYSGLVRRAQETEKKNPDVFRKLLDHHTDQFVPGLYIHWNLGSRDSSFSINSMGPRSKKDDPFMLVYGNKVGGEWYSYYHFRFKTTQYRKDAVEKWSPLFFPRGPSTRHGRPPCHLFNGKGEYVEQIVWKKQGRRLPGTPSRPIVLRDKTGDVVPVDEITEKRLCCVYQSAACDLNYWPGACNRRDWFDSINLMTEIDVRATQEVALRSLKAAVELTAEFPQIGMFLIPASRTTHDWSVSSPSGFNRPVSWFKEGGAIAAGKTAMPSIVLYWFDYREDGLGQDGESHWSYLDITIPPHGNEGLDPRGKLSPACYASASERQIYHDLKAVLPGSRETTRSPEFQGYKYGKAPSHYREYESKLVLWPDHRDKVFVNLHTDTEAEEHPIWGDHALAMRPDELQSAVRQKFLLESLPLC